MNMKKIVYILLLFLASSPLFCEQFIFKYRKGDKYRLITNVRQKVYLDGEFHHTGEAINKIAIEIIDVDGKMGLLSGIFQVSEKSQTTDNISRLEEEVEVTFWRDEQGKYEEKPNHLYPIVRDVPLFPKKELSPGDKWKAEGREFRDFRHFNIQMPIEIPVEVNYTYVRNTTINNTNIAVLSINYELYRELPELRYMHGVLPHLIHGKITQTYYWDIKKGRVHSYEDEFDVIYYFNNRQTMEFVGTSRGEVIESPEMNREKMKDEIEKKIKEENIEDTTVSMDDSGVTITLENINFLPESDVLLPKEQEKLKKIAKILRKYPGRDLLIAGHTALAGTEEGRQILSDKRAKAVGEFLIYLGIKNNMSFKGYGALFPVADNSTEKGMKKNRRVEIKILEN